MEKQTITVTTSPFTGSTDSLQNTVNVHCYVGSGTAVLSINGEPYVQTDPANGKLDQEYQPWYGQPYILSVTSSVTPAYCTVQQYSDSIWVNFLFRGDALLLGIIISLLWLFAVGLRKSLLVRR